MRRIELKFTDDNLQQIAYFLGNRYGRRKGIERRMKCAMWEIVAEEAKKVIEKQGYAKVW